MSKHGDDLLTIDARKPFQEIVRARARLQILEQGAHRNPRAREHPRSSHAAGNAFNGGARCPIHLVFGRSPRAPSSPCVSRSARLDQSYHSPRGRCTAASCPAKSRSPRSSPRLGMSCPTECPTRPAVRRVGYPGRAARTSCRRGLCRRRSSKAETGTPRVERRHPPPSSDRPAGRVPRP